MSIFIDGDFPVEGKCEYFRSPSCHPAQIGDEWVYGCLNENHPSYDPGDFCPIVNCKGDKNNCEIKEEPMSEFKTSLSLSEKAAELIAESQNYELQVKEIKIDSADQRANAVNLGIKLNKLTKDLEAERLSQTRPIDAAKDKIMDLYKPVTNACKTMVNTLKDAVGIFDATERRRVALEQARLQAEAEETARKERERLAKLAEKQIDKGQEEKAEETIQKIETVQAFVPVVAPQIVQQKGEKKRMVPKFEVVDFKALPDEYKLSDDVKIRKVVNALKLDANIPGVKVWEEEQQSW